jgi:S-adenosylmethionine decarboxylase
LKSLGRHVLLELKDCNPAILDNLDYLKRSLRETAELIGATVIGESFNRFNPHGVSGVVVISESHLCIHTWPEYCYAAVDVFTCGETVDPLKAIEPLTRLLESQKHSHYEIERGVLEPSRIGCKP